MFFFLELAKLENWLAFIKIFISYVSCIECGKAILWMQLHVLLGFNYWDIDWWGYQSRKFVTRGTPHPYPTPCPPNCCFNKLIPKMFCSLWWENENEVKGAENLSTQSLFDSDWCRAPSQRKRFNGLVVFICIAQSFGP